MESFFQLVWIALAGTTGVLLRFGIDKTLAGKSGDFPLSTWIINILGSFLAGLLMTLFDRGIAATEWKTPLIVGFLGGFTTFSAYSLQTAGMLDSGRFVTALLYWVTSPALGLGAAWAGLRLGRNL